MSSSPWVRVLLVAVCCGAASVPVLAQKEKAEDVDPEPPAAYKPPKTFEDLARLTENPKHLSRGAALLRKKHDELEDVTKAYKPRRRGGIGIGQPALHDGIEMKMRNLSKKTLTAAELKTDKHDLVRLANLTVAINEVVRLFPPVKPAGGKGVKEWLQYVDDVKKGAEELRKAARAGDAAAVRRAATRINDGCISCHELFRDS
jgi:Cytochrome C'